MPAVRLVVRSFLSIYFVVRTVFIDLAKMLRTMLKATLQMSTAAPIGTNKLGTRGSISGVFDPFNTNLRRNPNANRNNRGSAVNQLLGRSSRQRSARGAVPGDLGDLEGGKRHGKVCFDCMLIYSEKEA